MSRSGGWRLSNKELCVAMKVGIVVQAMVGGRVSVFK